MVQSFCEKNRTVFDVEFTSNVSVREVREITLKIQHICEGRLIWLKVFFCLCIFSLSCQYEFNGFIQQRRLMKHCMKLLFFFFFWIIYYINIIIIKICIFGGKHENAAHFCTLIHTRHTKQANANHFVVLFYAFPAKANLYLFELKKRKKKKKKKKTRNNVFCACFGCYRLRNGDTNDNHLR